MPPGVKRSNRRPMSSQLDPLSCPRPPSHVPRPQRPLCQARPGQLERRGGPGGGEGPREAGPRTASGASIRVPSPAPRHADCAARVPRQRTLYILVCLAAAAAAAARGGLRDSARTVEGADPAQPRHACAPRHSRACVHPSKSFAAGPEPAGALERRLMCFRPCRDACAHGRLSPLPPSLPPSLSRAHGRRVQTQPAGRGTCPPSRRAPLPWPKATYGAPHLLPRRRQVVAEEAVRRRGWRPCHQVGADDGARARSQHLVPPCRTKVSAALGEANQLTTRRKARQGGGQHHIEGVGQPEVQHGARHARSDASAQPAALDGERDAVLVRPSPGL